MYTLAYNHTVNQYISMCTGFKFTSQILLQQLFTRYLHTRFYATEHSHLTVKLRTGSPKTARNEQDCAHQKSYRK